LLKEVSTIDNNKTGELILALRKERNLTQKQLADVLNLSDRTISKWERGIGCPDVSLLNKLSEVFEVSIDRILAGDLASNEKDSGNMRKIKFYVCPICGNALFSTGKADISCCGRKLAPLSAKANIENHEMVVAEVEDDYYITIDHEMSKTHFVSFVAFVGFDRVFFIKLYPEQNAEIRFSKQPGYKLYAYCSLHGLWEERL
jgi:transcriptional regulator with XRE-family HTH domain/desulfoferrodoxin (superoxide reductase-like protein)